ncbi:MAG: hypothetical protein ACREDR_06245, partial [Blastocatellia bacterium]
TVYFAWIIEDLGFATIAGRMARAYHVSRSYGKGSDFLFIENIPIVGCPHSGESDPTAETLLEIERIKLHRKSFASQRKVAVASFVQARP